LAKQRALLVSGLLRIARGLEGVIEAVCAGDVNLANDQWPAELSQSDRLEAANQATPGRIPAQLSEGAPRQFQEALQEEGLEQCPEYDVFTSIKMRTLFQAQAKAADDLALGHKDVVIMRTGGRLRVLETLVGGRTPLKKQVTNLDVLTPSREWPGDHFVTLCTAVLQ